MPQNVLITGATSGFGREFAKLFAADGAHLILVARHADDLRETEAMLQRDHRPAGVTIVAQDLSEPGSPQKLHDEIEAHGLRVDVLINNAGFGEHGHFVETDLDKELKIIQLNIATVTHLTKLYLREMVARNEGKILQLASVLSFIPTPRMAVYAATKAYVLSLTEALQHEIKDSGVTMTALCPGAGDTEFFERANATEARIVQDGPLADPAEVAKAGYDALMSGKKRIVPGGMNKAQAWLSNLVPDAALAAGMSFMLEEK
ncbi:MAG: SDR family oxidoreductase [Catalinimonas sp.]